MKKNGWGLRVELLFILLFIVCLIIAVIGLNRMGVIGGDLSSINVGNNKESIEVYYMLENDLVNIATNYVNDYYEGNYPEEEFDVRSSTIVNTGYMSKLKDSKGRECTGYVTVKQINSSLIYMPYIKCIKYKTEGYISNKDW